MELTLAHCVGGAILYHHLVSGLGNGKVWNLWATRGGEGGGDCCLSVVSSKHPLSIATPTPPTGRSVSTFLLQRHPH